MKKSLLFTFSMFMMYSAAYAAPHDAFLMAKDFNTPQTNLKITASYDAVNDKIDFLKFRAKEGITDNSKGDYQGFSVGAIYDFDPQWAIEGNYLNREIKYNPDVNKIDSYLFAIRFSPDFNLDKNNAITFRANIWGNKSNTLSKTSPTAIKSSLASDGSITVNQVHVNDPRDLQIQLDAIFSKKLDPLNQINGFLSIGHSEVKVKSLKLIRGQNAVEIDKNNQITIDGISVNRLAQALGFDFDMNKNLNYDAYYASIGGSWNWRYKQFESQLAYQYQYHWRHDIDDQISTFGNAPIKDNHTIGAKFSYDFTPRATGFIKGEIYQHNLIGYTPFLYNGITASRLDKRYGLASLGVQFRAF